MPTREQIQAQLPPYTRQRPTVHQSLRALQPKVGEAQVALSSDLAALERALAEAFARSDASATVRERAKRLAEDKRKKDRR